MDDRDALWAKLAELREKLGTISPGITMEYPCSSVFEASSSNVVAELDQCVTGLRLLLETVDSPLSHNERRDLLENVRLTLEHTHQLALAQPTTLDQIHQSLTHIYAVIGYQSSTRQELEYDLATTQALIDNLPNSEERCFSVFQNEANSLPDEFRYCVDFLYAVIHAPSSEISYHERPSFVAEVEQSLEHTRYFVVTNPSFGIIHQRIKQLCEIIRIYLENNFHVT